MAIEQYDPSDPKVIHKRILEYVQTANNLCKQKNVSELIEEDGIKFLSGVDGYGQFKVPLHVEIDGQVPESYVMVLHYGYINSSEFSVVVGDRLPFTTTFDENSQAPHKPENNNPQNLEQANIEFIISTLDKISTFLSKQQNLEHEETKSHVEIGIE